MTNRAAAARYAKALLDVVRLEGDPQQAEQDLAAFVDLLAQHPTLQKVLTNPAIPAPSKRAAVQALVDRATPMTAVGKLLLLLAERDRLELLPELLASFHAGVLDLLHVVQAEVTTATALAPDRADALRTRLEEVTGRAVIVRAHVDPAIIGGVVARIGSTVYDGSVATQLARMRAQLVAETRP